MSPAAPPACRRTEERREWTSQTATDRGGSDGAAAVRGEEGHRRPGPPARAADRRAARARPHPRRGRAGPGQDDGDQDPGRGDRRRVQADPVHARPRPRRPHRHADLQPEDRRVRDVARPGLRQPPARRRDQPRAGQGPERAARGDAGAPGDDRARDLQGPEPVPRAGDPEPDRDRGDLRPARGADRPVHDQGPRRLPEPDRGVRHRRADDRACCRRSQQVLTTDGPARDAAGRRPRLRRPGAVRVRGPPGDGHPGARGARPRRAEALHHLRREPARVDQPDPHGAGARLRPRPRLRRCPRTCSTWPSTSCAIASCCRSRRCPTT